MSIRLATIADMESFNRVNDGLSIVEEAVNGTAKKRRYIEGAFISLNKKNQNGRYYTDENFLPQLDIYKSNWINADRAMGELMHSGKPKVNPINACIKIVDAQVGFNGDNNLIYGKALVMNTPYGKLLDAILDDVKMAVSSRCSAIIHSNGFTEVEEIVTLADVVVDPSAREAMVTCVEEQFDYLTSGIASANQMFDQFRKGMSVAKTNELVDKALNGFLNAVNRNLNKSNIAL